MQVYEWFLVFTSNEWRDLVNIKPCTEFAGSKNEQVRRARARTRKCYSEFVTFHKRNEVSARFCAMPRANFVICDFRCGATTFFEEEIVQEITKYFVPCTWDIDMQDAWNKKILSWTWAWIYSDYSLKIVYISQPSWNFFLGPVYTRASAARKGRIKRDRRGPGASMMPVIDKQLNQPCWLSLVT